jgi:hypothetical protein
MTLDEQLRRAFETLSDRLRDEVSRHAQTVIDELAVTVPPPPEPPPPAPPPTVEVVRDDGAAMRLAETIRDFDRARTLTEILDTLTTAAEREAPGSAVLLVRDGRYVAWRSAGFEPELGRGTAVDLPPDAALVPMAISGQVVAALYAPNPEPETPNPEPGTPNPFLEILARHAARCLESITAFKAARAALANGSSAHGEHASDEAANDDGAAARRYARLLVSEIKLYHEPAVAAGVRERDLATRLGGEIARARAMYEQRVPPRVREHADYFRDELIRTLANGDESLLELGT